MKNINKTAILIVIFIALMCHLTSAQDNGELKTVNIFEGAKLYKTGEVNIIELHGNYREMGKQYGYLLKNELNEFYHFAIEDYFIKEKKLPATTIKQLCMSRFALYPERLKNIIYGIAETSQLDLTQLVMLDQIVSLGRIADSATGCSAISAWGSYTDNNNLIFGRNFDWYEDYKKFNKFILLTVYNPDDGSIPVASVGYMGQIQLLTGINGKGIFLEMNDGSASGGNIVKLDRIDSFITFFALLLDNTSLTQLEASIKSHETFYPAILNVADKNKAYSYEWSTFDLKKREGQDAGLMVATNHFIDSSWNIMSPSPLSSTMVRYNNLMNMAKKYKGRFNTGKMMEILDMDIKNGGATKSNTIYQVVVIPGELKLWLKIPSYQEWNEIDLNKFFIKDDNPFRVN